MNIILLKHNVEKRKNDWCSLFQCHCGNSFVCRNTAIKNEVTKSCGCLLSKNKSPIKIGDIFDKLTVIKQVGINSNGVIKFLTKCQCGNDHITHSTNLRKKVSTDCGCQRSIKITRSSHENLLNKIFGRIKVIYKEETIINNSLTIRWMYLCRCGVIKYTTSKNVKSIRSCGCLHLEHARKVFYKHGKSRTKEYSRIYKIRRRDREKVDDIWNESYDKFVRLNFTSCAICNVNSRLELDHVRPLSLGYKLDIFNVCVLCKSCNSSKSNKDIIELRSDIRDKIINQSIDIVNGYLQENGDIDEASFNADFSA